MYDYWGFWIEGNVWNNVFWYPFNKQQKLWVAPLIEIHQRDVVNHLSVWKDTVFVEKDWEIEKEYRWLESFLYFTYWNTCIYIFDNHNHAFSFWRRSFFKWEIEKGFTLVHIDQHSDMNSNPFNLKNKDWRSVVEFTNYKCNVWNFIQPALDCWIIWNVKQIRTEYSLLWYKWEEKDFILDIDLDFWDSSMGIENKVWTIQKIKELIKQASLVTIATSPYFLDQNRAIDLLKNILL